MGGDFGDGEMERVVERMDAFSKKYGGGSGGSGGGGGKVKVQECENKGEVKSLTAFRFVAAPAFRTWCVGENVQGFSVDYALPISSKDIPNLGEGGKTNNNGGSSSAAVIQPIKRMRYSHFGCNVVHEDLAYALGVDV